MNYKPDEGKIISEELFWKATMLNFGGFTSFQIWGTFIEKKSEQTLISRKRRNLSKMPSKCIIDQYLSSSHRYLDHHWVICGFSAKLCFRRYGFCTMNIEGVNFLTSNNFFSRLFIKKAQQRRCCSLDLLSNGVRTVIVWFVNFRPN